jgi:alpha-tubulin suppressor-like RCC1 family protein
MTTMVYILANVTRALGAVRGPGAVRGRAGTTRRALAAAAAALVTVLAVAACDSGAPTSSPTSSPAPRTTSDVYRWGVVGNQGKIAQLELGAPAAISGITGKVVQIATSNSDGYALTSAGQVFAWGVNSFAELGDGHETPYQTRAVKVDFPAGVKIASLPNPMPFDGGLAIDSTGHAWGWGLNADDDLCLSGLIEATPQKLALSGVTLATGARTHALFYARGALYACGSGDAGELGDGSTASSARPARVSGLPSGVQVTALTSSWEGSGALLANGDYYDWGYNAAGQLGDGNTRDSAGPAKVDLPGPVTEVFQGGSGPANGQTVAVLAGGSVWAWGNNQRGQLGDGTLTSSDVPVRVHVPHGVMFAKVNSGGYTSFAIDSSGRLWAWGGNENGELGIGSLAVGGLEEHPVSVGINLTEVSSTASNVAGLSPGRPRG